MKNTNKWVAEQAVMINKIITMLRSRKWGKNKAKKRIRALLKQTQQDTLQWCLDEVGKKKERKLDEVPGVDNYRRAEGFNWALEELRQTIKKKMEEA